MMHKYITFIIAAMFFSPAAYSQEIKNDWMASYTLEASGAYEKAAAVLAPYTHSGERSEFALLRYAWLNYLQGNFNDSITAYKRAMKLNNRSIDAKLGVTLPLMAQQRWREAMKYTNQVLAQAPLNYTAHARLMVCEEGLRQWQKLEKHANIVETFYPTDANALVYLARAYAWQGKTLLAKSSYNKVLIRIPSHVEALRFLKNNP